MKNMEKYRDEIMVAAKENKFCEIFEKYVLPRFGIACSDSRCCMCPALFSLWAVEEYKEPEVDWTNVKVDTPILVRDSEDEDWFPQHFAGYNESVFAWEHGKTSHTTTATTYWNYAKLAEVDE